MQEIFEFLKGFSFQNVLSMVAIMWFFTRQIKSSLESLHRDFMDMNTRVSRIEGTVYGKDLYTKRKE